MRVSVLAIVTALTFNSYFAFADELSPADEIRQVRSVVSTPIQVQNDIAASLKSRANLQIHPYSGGGAEALVAIAQIINLGKQIWEVVEAGQPVVSVQYDYANALPKGLTGVEELDGFSPLQFTSFREYGINGFGYTVYDLTYTVAYRYGGSYKGRGQYLDAVAIVPQKVEVSWMYNVEFKVTKVSVANVGTADRPVAGMVLESMFKVSTVLKEYQSRGIFDIRGDSNELRYSL